GDTVARLGGDEFAVLMEDADEHSAVTVADRFLLALAQPIVLEGGETTLSASAGIVTAGFEHTSTAELLRNADVAMYSAKSAGRARHAVFRPEMHDAVVRRAALQSELRHAVEH